MKVVKLFNCWIYCVQIALFKDKQIKIPVTSQGPLRVLIHFCVDVTKIMRTLDEEMEEKRIKYCFLCRFAFIICVVSVSQLLVIYLLANIKMRLGLYNELRLDHHYGSVWIHETSFVSVRKVQTLLLLSCNRCRQTHFCHESINYSKHRLINLITIAVG